ncbi:MAG TPA: serine/threonine-protein kinase [Pirellulaceae bacterium]|nr:serine/threonine-protein kinase [Pirellulaceae bacterium]
MAVVKPCPQCGCDMPLDSPAGLCPECLLGVGLDASEPELDSDSPTEARPVPGFIPPQPHELADCFPQFEILNLLGYGGMGAVYKARQKSLDRLVALKIIKPDVAHDPGFAERFAREARALARLNHSNIVGVYDFGEASGSGRGSVGDRPQPLYYFVMEYVDGTNLRRLIESKELAAEQALQIIPQVCEALQFAHDEGIIHRDIKPENILVDSKARVKIADFGLAKLLGKTAVQDHTLTGTHQVMGTPRYMAPEQMEGSKTIDHRADIYSLGVVFYEMLTGEVPMGSFEPPSRKVQVDVRLDEIVLRSLAREPARRYQHASDVKTDVESVSQSGASIPPDVAEPAKVPKGRVSDAGNLASSTTGHEALPDNRLIIAILLLLFFGSVTGVALMFMPWSDVRIEVLPRGDRLSARAGTMKLLSAEGHHYSLTVFGAVMSLGLFVVTLITTLIGQSASALRAMLAAATGTMLALTGGLVFALSPLPNIPDDYSSVLRQFGHHFTDRGWSMREVHNLQVHGSLNVRVDMDGSGCFTSLLVGVALIVAAVLEMRLVLVQQLEHAGRDTDALLRGPTRALRWSALSSPLMIPVLFAINLGNSSDHSSISTVLLVLLVLQIIHAIVLLPLILTGVSRMQSRRSLGWAKAASIAAMLPLGLSFIVGIPAGIWALVVLGLDEVAGDFEKRERPKQDHEVSAVRHVKWPAIGLIVTGVVGCLLAIAMFSMLVTGVVNGVPWAEAAGASSPIFFVALWAPTVLAGVFMLRRQAYRFVFAYSMLSIVFSLINLLGLPVGIWAITVLLQDDVKNAFGIKTKQAKKPKPFEGEQAEEEDAYPLEKVQTAAYWVGAVKLPLQKRDGDILGSTLSNAWTDWWRERDVLFTRSVQTVVMLLHIACLLAFLGFSSQATKNDDGQRMFTHEIGSPTPWFTVEATSDPGFSFHYAIHWSSSAWMVAVCGGGLAYVYCHIEKVRNPERGYWDKPQAFMLVWCILALADIGLGVSMGQLATNSNRTGGPTTPGSDEVRTYDTPKSSEVEVRID